MKSQTLKLITSLLLFVPVLIAAPAASMPLSGASDSLAQRINLHHGSQRNANRESIISPEPLKGRDIEATAEEQFGPHSHGEGWP